MKTLIIYAGKYGCTKECAEKLKSQIEGETTVVNAAKEKMPIIEEYDTIIIGSSIYVGQIHKKVKTFISDNLSELKKKNVGLFLVCGFIDKFDETVAANFPKEFREHAQSIECFGGELNVEKMNFLHKSVMKMIEKEVDVSSIKLMPENIKKMINEMRM